MLLIIIVILDFKIFFNDVSILYFDHCDLMNFKLQLALFLDVLKNMHHATFKMSILHSKNNHSAFLVK